MSYLGNNPNKGSFFQQKFTGDGSTTAFTLLQSVTDGSQLIITIGNVIQEEGSGKAYTASGTTLTFDSAPANNDVIVVRYLGRSLDTPTTYATQITYKYVATNAQTAFSGSDANGNTLSYTIGSVDVYLNGVHLDTTDFTETNESTITLASGATTNDELVIVAKRTITLTDVVPKSAGGTFAGDVIAGGALTVNGAFTSQGIDDNADATAITIDSSENVSMAGTLAVTGAVTANAGISIDNITIDGTEIDLSSGDLTLDVAGDIILDADGDQIRFKADGTQFGLIGNESSDFLIQSSVQDKDIVFQGNDGGSAVTAMTLDMSAGGMVKIGDDDSGSAGVTGIQLQNSQDFATVYDGTNVGTFAGIQTVNHDDTSNRTGTGITFVHRSSSSGIASIQSTSSASDRADLRFVTRGSDGINQRVLIDDSGNVGILNNSPSSYGNATELVVGSHSIDDAGITIATTTNSSGRLQFSDNTSDPFRGCVEYSHGNDFMFFYTNGLQRLKITNQGFIQSPPTSGNTTSASSNMHCTVGGEFAKSTSSERYKNTINDATHGLAELLKLRSVTYKGNNDGDTIFGGLIAEEVHDAGLTEFVVYDEENRPDALHYPHMIALCVKAIQELEAKVKELGGK